MYVCVHSCVCVCVCVITHPSAQLEYVKMSSFKQSLTNLNQNFPSPWSVDDKRLKPSLPYALLYAYSWGKNNWIHIFTKSIRAMWNVIDFIQDLDTCRLARFLRR